MSPLNIKITYKKLFYLILFLGLLARVYVAFFLDLTWYDPDTENYLKMAKAIIDGNPLHYFPNGLPLLLAGIMLIAPDNVPVIVVLLNIVLQIAAVILMEKILSRYNIDEKIRLIIIFIIVFYPHQVDSVRLILSEIPALFLIMLSLMFYSYGKYPACGFTGYLAYTFRSTLFFVLPLIIIYDFFKGKKISALKSTAGFLVGVLIFIFLDGIGVVDSPDNYEDNLLVAINSYGYDIDFKLEESGEYEIRHPVKTYFNFILNNPVEYTKQRFLSLWCLWGPIVYDDYSFKTLVIYSIRFPFFILALLAFIFRNKMEYGKDLVILMSFPVISITVIHFFFFSIPRHPVVAEPFVIVLSVLFLGYLIKLKKSKKI